MNFNFNVYKENNIIYGAEDKDNYVQPIFNIATTKRCLKNVTINDITYKKNTIVILDISDDGPEFGQIQKIYLVDDKVLFKCTPINTIGFNSHYFAYSTNVNINDEQFIYYDKLAIRTPCLMFVRNGANFVATRHIL